MAEFSEQQSKMVEFSEQRDKMSHHSRALKQQIQSAFHRGLMQLHSREQQLLNMVDELTSQQEAALLKKSLHPETEAEEAKDADMAEEEVKDQEVEMLEKPEKEQQPENSEDQGEKEEGTEQKDRQSTWLPLSVSVPALKIDAKQLEDAIHDFATLQSGAMDLESSDFCQDSMMSDDTRSEPSRGRGRGRRGRPPYSPYWPMWGSRGPYGGPWMGAGPWMGPGGGPGAGPTHPGTKPVNKATKKPKEGAKKPSEAAKDGASEGAKGGEGAKEGGGEGAEGGAAKKEENGGKGGANELRRPWRTGAYRKRMKREAEKEASSFNKLVNRGRGRGQWW